MRALLAACILASALAVGCIGGDDEDAPETEVQTLPPQTAGELGRPGRIAGIVTDIALQPVTGATVRLLEHDNITTTTRGDGAYVLRDLPPASYLVRAEAEGFLGQTYLVDVFRDQTTVLDVVLAREPTANPYFETLELEGLISCRAAFGQGEGGETGVACPVPDENERTSFEFPVAAMPARVVIEVTWEPQSELAKMLEAEASTAMLGDQDATLAQGEGLPVLRLEVPGSDMDRFYPEGGVMRLDVGLAPGAGDEEGARAGAAIQQAFTVYVTVFYVDPGAPDFTALSASG